MFLASFSSKLKRACRKFLGCLRCPKHEEQIDEMLGEADVEMRDMKVRGRKTTKGSS